MKNLIRKILKEIYSPAGKEYTPGRFVVHKSAPTWRDSIKNLGLTATVGDCYQEHVGGDVDCQEAIFATDSMKKKYWFDSTYDDDTWLIDTECAGVTWYKDRHFEDSYYKYHIVTFEDIPANCLKLIHKGTGEWS